MDSQLTERGSVLYNQSIMLFIAAVYSHARVVDPHEYGSGGAELRSFSAQCVEDDQLLQPRDAARGLWLPCPGPSPPQPKIAV